MHPRAASAVPLQLSTSQKMALQVAYVQYAGFMHTPHPGGWSPQDSAQHAAYLDALERAWRADGNTRRPVTIAAVGAALKRWRLLG